MLIKANQKIVFFGDSITDTGRLVHKDSINGAGYASMVVDYFNVHFSPYNLTFKNLGISGNRTCDLVNRLPEVIEQKPDIVLILIGVNDSWRKYDRNMETTHQEFEDNYCQVIETLKQSNKDMQIILLEPFILPVQEWVNQLYEDLNPKIEIVNQLAKKYDLPLIKLSEIMNDLATKIPANKLLIEGVHPTTIGHAFIADQIINLLIK